MAVTYIYIYIHVYSRLVYTYMKGICVYLSLRKQLYKYFGELGWGWEEPFRKVQILNVSWCQAAPAGGKRLINLQ